MSNDQLVSILARMDGLWVILNFEDGSSMPQGQVIVYGNLTDPKKIQIGQVTIYDRPNGLLIFGPVSGLAVQA